MTILRSKPFKNIISTLVVGSSVLSPCLVLVSANANTVSSNVPLRTYEVEGSSISLPDWGQINFESLPVYSQDGSIEAPIGGSGYDPTKTWQAGEHVTNVGTLGDFQDSFGLERLTPEEIFQFESRNTLDNATLDGLGVLQSQSIDNIVDAVELEEYTPAEVPLLDDLLSQNGGSGLRNMTFAEIRNSSNAGLLSSITTDEIDLSQYFYSDVIGLEQTELGRFEDWESTLISEIEGLDQVPFNEFLDEPIIGEISGNSPIPVARIDVPYGSKETDRIETITGSDVEGFNVDCDSPCAYLELTDIIPSFKSFPENISRHGNQWISGRDQLVDGGAGSCFIPDIEPTGRHPIGPKVKIVLIDVNESSGTGSFMFFIRPPCPFPFGKMPYIFPLPIIVEFSETTPIYVGDK